MSFAAVILAAGKSTRMKSALPKAVHKVCGKPVTRHVIDACFGAGVDQVIVVVGHEAELVKQTLGSDVTYILQAEQLGTGHAAMQAMPEIDRSDVLILPGDAPLITSETVSKLMSFHTEESASCTLLTAILDEPGSYGRAVRGPDGNVERITEARDASPKVLAINECAMSIYSLNTDMLRESLSELRADNAQKEYYLTDVIEILRGKGKTVKALPAEDPRDTLGINTRIELADAAQIMRCRILDRMMLDGVSVVDPATTYVDAGVLVGRDTIIHPCSVIEGISTVGSNCVIGPFARVKNIIVPDGAVVGAFEQMLGEEL